MSTTTTRAHHLCAALLLATLAHAQSTPTPTTLLQQTAAAYATPTPLHLESIDESTDSNELMNLRTTHAATLIRGANGRFRIETHSPYGSWLQVSDGATESILWITANRYVQHPFSGKDPFFYRAGVGDSNLLAATWLTPTLLHNMASDSVNPTRLPDETITLDGHPFPCCVIHAQAPGQTPETASDRTFWIDRQNHLFRKIVQHNSSFLIEGDVHAPFVQDITTTYPIADLDATPPAGAFTFTPPPGATQIRRLEANWMRNLPTPESFPATPAPNVTLLDAQGKSIPLSSYRGHPVLIDLWATWCAPCLQAMPSFAKIAETYRNSGLTILSIDDDENPQQATAYLDSHAYRWTNYHDENSAIEQAFQTESIPRTLLIDGLGNLVFSQTGADTEADLADLRTAITRALPPPGARQIDTIRPSNLEKHSKSPCQPPETHQNHANQTKQIR